MIRFEGTRDISQPPGELWPHLRDARFLVQCIPDGSTEGTPTSDRAVVTVRPGLTFVRGNLEVTMQVQEAIPNQSLKLLLTSKGIGSANDVEVVLQFAPQDTGTRITWAAEVTRLAGLLRAVPVGLIRGAAQKVIDDLWKSVETRLKTPLGDP